MGAGVTEKEGKDFLEIVSPRGALGVEGAVVAGEGHGEGGGGGGVEGLLRDTIAALTLEVEELRGRLRQLEAPGAEEGPHAHSQEARAAPPQEAREEGGVEGGEGVQEDGGAVGTGLVQGAGDDVEVEEEMGMGDVKEGNTRAGLEMAVQGEEGPTAGGGEEVARAEAEAAGGGGAASASRAGVASRAVDAPVPSQVRGARRACESALRGARDLEMG